MNRNDDELDSLLAKGRLSGPQRERMFAQVLANSGAKKRRWPRIGVWVASLAAAAAALVLLVRPDGFRARGHAAPVLEVACLEPTCASGGTLLFRVGGAVEGGYLHAWAEPAGGGERVWYFPGEGAPAPSVGGNAGMQTLHEAVRLGAPGSYRVHLVLAKRPLTRDELAAPPAEATLATVIAPLVVP